MPLTNFRRHLLCTTMCCLLTLSISDAHAAFDPDAGKEDAAIQSTTHNLARKRSAPAPMMMINRSAAPLYPEADRGYVKSDVAMPKPLYPTRETAAPVAQTADIIEPHVETIAQEPVIAATPLAPLGDVSQPNNGEVQMAGYIAPPPPMPNIVPMTSVPEPTGAIASAPATTPVAVNNEGAPVDIVAPSDPRLSTGKAMNSATTVIAPPPVMASAAPAPAAMPQSSLSAETKEILGRIPSRIGAGQIQTASKTTLDRVSPEVTDLIPNLKESEFESAGLKITVSRDSFDANYELNRAYEALIAGDSEMAVDIYQNILASDPKNEDALFGLAATYHRAGETTKARPLYGALLRINPDHREALNNFLVLVSDEAPEEALFELQKLSERNPDFSPIRAQMALVLEKLGQHDLAREQMIRAIRMSPENLVYKYNLAVMMDRQGRYADAAALYNLLIEASLRGESIPAPLEEIQKRMTYIQTAALDLTRGG